MPLRHTVPRGYVHIYACVYLQTFVEKCYQRLLESQTEHVDEGKATHTI